VALGFENAIIGFIIHFGIRSLGRPFSPEVRHLFGFLWLSRYLYPAFQESGWAWPSCSSQRECAAGPVVQLGRGHPVHTFGASQ
jgi:hypothetical protein